MALYVSTLAISIIIATIGWALIVTQSSDRELQTAILADTASRWCARAGVEMAMVFMEQLSDWRQRVTGSTLLSNIPVGRGTCTVQVYDDRDGSITNNAADAVRVVSTGSAGGGTYILQVRLVPRPHKALSYCAFGIGSNAMSLGSTINTVLKGPVRSHGNITAGTSTTTQDDASFETMTGYTIAAALNPKSYVGTAIPGPAVSIPTYVAMGAPSYGTYGGNTCNFKGVYLSPTSNPTGTVNASGIYVLDAGARNVVVENTHIKGTLIITNVAAKTITFQGGAWIEPGPLNYPVVLIDNSAAVNFNLNLSLALESTISVAYGRSGTSYTATGADLNENGNQLDTLPTSVRGIIWANCTGALTMQNSAWPFTGSVIAQQLTINIGSIDNDPSLLDSFSPGFLDSGMRIKTGSFAEAGY